MKIKMLKSFKYSYDGIHARDFIKGEELEMSEKEALDIILNKLAEEVKEEKMMSKPENKMITKSENKRISNSKKGSKKSA